MADLRLEWHIEGEKQVSRKLRGIAESLRDWTPAFQKIAGELRRDFSGDVFESEGEAIGERWTPLSRAYAERKAVKYPGKGILEATGKMRRAFQSQYDATSARVWNNIAYFKYHQSNKLPRRKLPRRVMMKLDNDRKEFIQRTFLEAVRGKI